MLSNRFSVKPDKEQQAPKLSNSN